MRSKVSELGVFSIGLGLIGAILLVMFQVVLGSSERQALFAICLGIALLFVVLGILTLVIKHKAAIWINLIFLVFGLLVFAGLGGLASMLALVGIVLVIITGRAALKEISESKRRTKKSKRRRRRSRVE